MSKPTTFITRKRIHCNGCGHSIRKDTPAVKEPYWNIHRQKMIHTYHYDPECLDRRLVPTFSGDPRNHPWSK